MKTKINILIGMSLLLSTSMIMAQSSAPAVTSVSSKIEGTPYLDESYTSAKVFFDNSNPAVVPMRYNVYQDFMEYTQNGQRLALDKNHVKKVKFGNQTFVVDKFEFRGKETKGYLSVLDSGKAMLFAKKVVIFMDAKPGRALDGTDLPAQYSKSADAYYYKVGDGELKQVGNMKEMIASFPNKQEELKQFVKKEKISPRKEQELIKLIQFYNSSDDLKVADSAKRD